MMLAILTMLKYLKKMADIFHVPLTYIQADQSYSLNTLQQPTEKGLDESPASHIRAY